MTLEQLEYNIGQIALKNNLVNAYFAGGSLYEINAEVVNEYPILFLTPAGDHTIKENTTRYSLTIYYADRLWDDDRNETDIVSAAIETLKNIKRQLPYLDWVAAVQEEPIIRLFTETEKMNDRLAGAYMNIWVEVMNASVCAEFLDELGRPLGNYIPGNLNVLDGFATKAWVIMQRYADKPWVLEQIANIQISAGTTPQQVLIMIESALTEYTKTENFATINNSAITNGGNFQLLEEAEFNAFLSAYTATIEQLIGVTSLILDFDEVSAMTAEERIAVYNQIKASYNSRLIYFRVRKDGDNERYLVPMFGVKSNYIDFVGYYNTGQYTAIYLYSNGNLIKDVMPVYSLPTASADVKGGVKIGSGLTMVGDTLYAEPSVSSSVTVEIAQLSAYTVESVSSITQEITNVSSITQNNTTAITQLSSMTEYNTSAITQLSSVTVSGFTDVYSAISVTETLISGNTQLINELSGATVSGLSSLTVDMTTLSAVTTGLLNGQAVVYDFSEWTGKTNDGKTAMRAQWQADYNAGKKVYMKALTTGNETVYLLLEKCESYDQFRYASDAYVCHLSISNTSAVGQSGGKVSKTDIITKSNLATKSATGIVKVGDGISVSQGTISADLRSDDVTFIWVGTQAQYDALSAVSNTTLYVIKSA